MVRWLGGAFLQSLLPTLFEKVCCVLLFVLAEVERVDLKAGGACREHRLFRRLGKELRPLSLHRLLSQLEVDLRFKRRRLTYGMQSVS